VSRASDTYVLLRAFLCTLLRSLSFDRRALRLQIDDDLLFIGERASGLYCNYPDLAMSIQHTVGNRSCSKFPADVRACSVILWPGSGFRFLMLGPAVFLGLLDLASNSCWNRVTPSHVPTPAFFDHPITKSHVKCRCPHSMFRKSTRGRRQDFTTNGRTSYPGRYGGLWSNADGPLWGHSPDRSGPNAELFALLVIGTLF
jgi:hypothetical protein